MPTFWNNLESVIHRLDNFDAHPETAKLKPRSKMFFVASVNAVLNHETSFFELVRKCFVNVHIASVDQLKAQTVVLFDG